MNNMSPMYPIVVAKQQQEREAGIRQIRLANAAAQTRPINGWTAHRIAQLAEWMIATGETLRQRYDHPPMHPRTGALAR